MTGRRLVAVALGLTVWVGGTIAGSLGTAPAAAGRPILEIGRAHADYAPALTGNDPIFILLLGSDARPGTPVERGLSDSIHILGINPAKRRATLIGIPRDSYVPLTTGGTSKINAAMPRGGPEATVATVERLTGIRFDYYVLTGFGGLSSAVQELGGIRIDIPYTFDGYDQQFTAGPHKLDGRSALQFARTRKSLSRGDFDRSMNQGRLLIASLTQFRKEYAKDGTTIFRWLGAGLRNVKTTLGLDELIGLGFTATVVSPKKVTNLVLMGSVSTINGMSVVNLSSENRRFFDDIKRDGYILPGAIPAAAQPSN